MLNDKVHKALLESCKDFKYTKENKEILSKICEHIESKNPKGILLAGNVGSGKTTIMHSIWKTVAHTELKFAYKTSRQIAREYAKQGYDGIESYMRANIDFCFDDLGAETNARFYGDEVNVFAEIIQDRYELFRFLKYRSHFTTNLTTQEIEKNYGDRVLSRLYEMCEFYILGTGESKDYRK